MRLITTTCDRCGDAVAAKGSLLELSGELRGVLPDRLDLCEQCSQKLIGWIREVAPDAAANDVPNYASQSGHLRP